MISLSILPHTGIKYTCEDGSFFHTFTDFALLWMGRDITSPEAKRHIISEVPGIDSVLERTSEMGPTRFYNRTIRDHFMILDKSYNEWESRRERIMNALHGRRVRITADTDPLCYWEGFTTVETIKDGAVISEFVISADVYPYKKYLEPLSKSQTITDSGTMTISNKRMPSSPVITASAAMTLVYRGREYVLAAGDNAMDFELYPFDDNTLAFTGSGTVTVTWTGGSL